MDTLAVFQDVDGSLQIMFDELPRVCRAIDSRQDAGIGGGVNDPIYRRERLKIAGAADIPVPHDDAERFQFGAIEFAAGAEQVIQSCNFHPVDMIAEPACERTADKSANTCNKNFHQYLSLP